SELAFVCNQENRHVAVLLIPLDVTFTSRHKATPVTIQKIEDQSGPSDVTLGKRTGLHTFGIAGRAGGTCLVPKGQRSRGCEIGSVLFPQRPGCDHAYNQSQSI